MLRTLRNRYRWAAILAISALLVAAFPVAAFASPDLAQLQQDLADAEAIQCDPQVPNGDRGPELIDDPAWAPTVGQAQAEWANPGGNKQWHPQGHDPGGQWSPTGETRTVQLPNPEPQGQIANPDYGPEFVDNPDYEQCMTDRAAAISAAQTALDEGESQRETGNPNPVCAEGTEVVAKFEWTGSGYVFEGPEGNESVVSVTGDETGGSWSSTVEIHQVLIKSSVDSKIAAGGMSGSFDNTGMLNPGGQVPDISNLQFCGGETVVEGTGELEVTKDEVVVGDVGDLPGGYGFTVECGEFALGDEGAFQLDDGESKTLGVAIPAGTDCTVTETDTVGAEDTTVAVDGGEPVEGTSTMVTIGEGTTTTVAFVNSFRGETVVEGTGELEVEKLVAGDGQPADDATFVVEVSCEGFGTGGDLVFDADGGLQDVGIGIPDGTDCTVTETGDGGADATYVVVDPAGDEAGAAGATAEVTIAEGETTLVRFTNTFDDDGGTNGGGTNGGGTNGGGTNGGGTNGGGTNSGNTEVRSSSVEAAGATGASASGTDETGVAGVQTPNRVDAGGGGAAGATLPIQLALAGLMAAAAAALALTEWRARRRLPVGWTASVR